ncbi:MAG: helix-turn-helix domain-containing protein, partial [Dehalococcoidales bacterium]|nr:helix-turn-helix domain-containing protein [Dehalococcoidales bacterium]
NMATPDIFDSGKKPVMVKSIYRTANILNCISNGINSITDIAAHCNLSKSTVHRLLHALGESGLVMRDPINREYLFGHLISRLVSNPRITHEYLIRSATREMQFLGDYTREAISLGIKAGMNYVGLHIIPSTYALRVVDDRNSFANLHVGSSGRVLLSQISNAELQRAMQYFKADLPDGQVPFDEKYLVADIERIREQGYAVSGGERVPGATCIAVPVKYYHLPAVLSLFGPESRISPHTREYLDALLAAANRIGMRIRETLTIS